MAEALHDGDSQRYARLLLESVLYLPQLPERDSPQWWELVDKLPLEQEQVLAFTSLRGMELVLGPYARGHKEASFAALAELWRNPQWLLAVNPGLPIGVVLPPAALPALARGEETLTPIADTQAEMEEGIEAEIGQLCLRGLGGSTESYASPPVNELERELDAARAQQDGETFLETLLAAEVVVPTTAPVSEHGELTEESFPWFTVGGGLPIVPVFSSAAVLDQVAAPGQERATLPLLSILAIWPDETHVLCFNPGAETQLVLFGDTVSELIATLADSARG